MKKIVLLCLVIGCEAFANAAADSPVAKPSSAVEITAEFVNQLADEAQTNNPSLRAAEARVQAASQHEKTIRTWEDPTARFGVMPAEESMRAEDGDLIYGVEQALPVFGKPQAARRVAEEETQFEKAEADSKFQKLRRDIAQTVFRVGLAERVVELGEEDLQWLRTIKATAEQRYATGDSSQMDVLRAQNEVDKRATQLKTDQDTLSHERLNLNRWLNRDLHAPWPSLRLPPVANPVHYNRRLVELAVKNEPDLKVRFRQIKQAEAQADQTRRRRYPDFNVGAEIRQFSQTGEFRQSMLAVSFNLPWGNRKKYEAEFQRDQEKVKAAQLEAADYELAVRDEIYHLTILIDAARREALLYRDTVIPRSEAALKSTRVAWESDRGTFQDLLEARRMLVEAHLMHAKAVTEQYHMLSELILCCGLGDLEALQMIGALPDSNTEEKE
mgnify:CR=1 FL=1